MNKRFFDNIDGADLQAFLMGLRQMLQTRLHHDIPDAGTEFMGAFTAASSLTPSANLSACLQLFADLNACGSLDKVLHGKGTITGKTQPYVLTIDDLSSLDPFCNAVSFLRYRKGNPWFAIDRADVAKPDATVKIYERRVRKKKVELTWQRGIRSGDLGAFMWNWFGDASLPHKAQFTDCVDDIDSFRAHAAICYANCITFSENATLFEDDNSNLLLSWGSIGWTAEFTINDIFQPHTISDNLISHTSLTPDALHRMLEKDRTRLMGKGSI